MKAYGEVDVETHIFFTQLYAPVDIPQEEINSSVPIG
jgi:hypothetical protein